MRPRICGVFCKLVQRQTYSFLSSRFGIVFCIGGTLLFLISLLQFGEVALEWSMAKYSNHLNARLDRLGGKILQITRCRDEPIDIVYTWVNGSDPVLIKELKSVKEAWTKAYKQKLRSQPEPTKPVKGASKKLPSSSEKDSKRWRDMWHCPLPNCVVFPAIAVSNSSIDRLHSVNSKFNRRNSLKYPSNDPSTVVIGFQNLKETRKTLEETFHICGHHCPNMSIVFITSTLKKGQPRLSKFGLLHDLNKSVGKSVIRKIFAQHKISLHNVYIDNTTNNSNIALLEFVNEGHLRKATYVPRISLMIGKKQQRVFGCGLVWKPITHLEEYGKSEYEDISSSRFADNEELRYSLRSVEKFAPWIQKIFIVTNGQIPSWLNLDNKRIELVTHDDIFQNRSHLPSFSSPAIETHIHRIKGLSKRFIYMNDDVFFGSPVWPDDFFTMGRGHKIYLTWPVPNCNEGCPASWISDKYCDKACNVSECDWDGGDCINPQVLRWQSQTVHGISVLASTEFCHSSCAHTWIGDRYCDAHCNVRACGYDAGDCGLDGLITIPSFYVKRNSKDVYFDDGVKAFYLNLTDIFKRGKISEGDFEDHPMIRSAVFSKAFNILSVTLFSNLSRTIIPFRLKGFQGMNQTEKIELFLNISVCSKDTGIKLKDSQYSTIKPVKITEKTLLFPKTIYNGSHYPRHWQRKIDKKLQLSKVHNVKNQSFQVHELDNVTLPAELLVKWRKIQEDFVNGDITLKGFNLSKALLLQEYYQQQKHKGDYSQVKVGRKLLSIDETFPQRRTEEQAEDQIDRKGFHKTRPVILVSGPSKCRLGRDGMGYILRKKIWHQTRSFVDKVFAWRQRYGNWDPITYPSQTSFLPWEKFDSFKDIAALRKQADKLGAYKSGLFRKRKLLDTFADSLLHVSKIYNRAFGYKARKVPAHMPHMIDRDIVYEMQDQFQHYFDLTSSHQIRSPNDMQFAFSYQYYIMGVPAKLNMTSLFMELDTDSSGALSDRELRTLAARLHELPLDLKTTVAFENIIKNCSSAYHTNEKTANIREDYYDPTMPLVTEELLSNCTTLVDKLNRSMKGKTKFKFEVLNDDDVGFKMIRNNLTHVLLQLDWIRKHKRKFICLNDNIDHLGPTAHTVRALVKDFFEALFPTPSQFEIARGYRNRYLYVHELRDSIKRKTEEKSRSYFIIIGVLIGLFLLMFLARIFRVVKTCFKFLFSLKIRQWTSRGILEI